MFYSWGLLDPAEPYHHQDCGQYKFHDERCDGEEELEVPVDRVNQAQYRQQEDYRRQGDDEHVAAELFDPQAKPIDDGRYAEEPGCGMELHRQEKILDGLG